MRGRARVQGAGLLVWALCACTQAPAPAPVPPPWRTPTTETAEPPPIADPFDTTVLHRIQLTIEPHHLAALDERPDERVPATMVINGVPLRDVGVRPKGARGSFRPMSDKPALSLTLDAFVKGQRYRGLDRLLLNNAVQDPSLLNEHLAYGLFRAHGLPAPRTAHTLVELNGRVLGFYVMREAFDKTFLRATFGDGSGNLYEGECCRSDFAPPNGAPSQLDLKDEEDGRTSEDLQAFADVLEVSPQAPGFEALLSEQLDVEAYLTYFALEGVLGHWDGYSFNLNNFYLYRRPRDERFVFLPHGMDQLLDRMGMSPLSPPAGRLAQALRENPSLDARLRERLDEVMAGWSEDALMHQAAQVRALVLSAESSSPGVLAAQREFDDAWHVQVQRLSHRAVVVRWMLAHDEALP